MFTGIIEELGKVQKIQRIARHTLLEIKTDKISRDANIGDSIAVNGACLTIAKKRDNILGFEIMPQTLQVANLAVLRMTQRVNLERALRLGDRVGGHFVYGHIDCTGIIRRRSFIRDNLCFEIAVPLEFMPMIILRGSVAIDGISLTVQGKKGNLFSVYIVPHTLKTTNLDFRRPSDKVNIETDKLATLATAR